MLKFWLAPLFLLLSLSPEAAFAWGADGHKIVCEIAYRELTPKARARVDQLLERDPEFKSFAAACVWADTVGNSTRPETKGWHFINLPKTATMVSPQECPRVEGCILSAVALHSAILSDPKASEARKLEALKYLGHWMGDFHQPLHLSFIEDRGGNYIPVRWKNFNDSDLHKVWDSVIIKDAMHLSGTGWKKLAARLNAEVTPAERHIWLKGETLDWANETFRITRAGETAYIGAKPNLLLDLNEAYFRANLLIVKRQLKRAGIRLGARLNNILGR